MSIQAVILAGGEGKRIHPLGLNKPKAMFELLGKPLIQLVVENLREAGISDLILITGPNQEQIQRHFDDGGNFGVKIQYAYQAEPLGQANAVQAAEGLVNTHFFVLNANDVFEPRLLQEVMAQAQASGANLALVGRKVSEPWRFGVMRFDDRGQLMGVIEKPPAGQEPSDVAVVGLYYFSPDIFQCIRDTPLGQTDDQFERAYQLLIDRGQAVHVEYDGLFESYKFPWNLLSINDLLLKQKIQGQQISPSAKISDLAIIGDNVIIEDNVRVFEHAVIRGPAYIGAGSVIGNGSMVWGGCSFGPGCVIGFGSEIKHSIFGRNVWTHRNYVGDSIISDNCSFGAGTITANFRFDEKEIPVNVGEQRISTGTDKFGVIMAEGCRTGCNSVLGPGVKIGPNSIVGPGVTLLEDLSPNKIALPTRASYEVRDNRLDLTAKTRDEQMKRLDKA
jgi:UDP-N-acetylglucosamine diphosphorylase / glucose-1-phosphate thymidylyltransferase / UDP-N-acetylgalactosamine diphosphorylase / glucosamine-1-phosphate N-acetyltransferase / galactosamine-1-phosphate N-acetyltransferase